MGMNTAARMRAIAMTGPDTSSIALRAASWGERPVFDVVLHRLYHNDCIIDDKPDRKNKSEKRQGINGEAKHGKDHEGSYQGDGNRQQRNERRSPALEKDVDDDDDQDQGFEQSLVDFMNALADGERCIEGDGVVEGPQESGLSPRSSFSGRRLAWSRALLPGVRSRARPEL